jgi:hypothetical protein
MHARCSGLILRARPRSPRPPALSASGCLRPARCERPRVRIKRDRPGRLVHPPRGIEPVRVRGARRRSARGTGGDGRRRRRRWEVPGRLLPEVRLRLERRGRGRDRAGGRCRARGRRPSGRGWCRPRAGRLSGRGRSRCTGDEGRRREEDANLHGRAPPEGPDRGSVMRRRGRPRDDPTSVRFPLSSIAGTHSSTPMYEPPCLPASRRGSPLIRINTAAGTGVRENREQGAGAATVCQCRGDRSSGRVRRLGHGGPAGCGVDVDRATLPFRAGGGVGRRPVARAVRGTS